jgi:hypothetical protein
MLDNAISEGQNAVSNMEETTEVTVQEPRRVEFFKESLCIPELQTVFDDEIRDDDHDWIDAFLYSITFGPEATNPLGLRLDWSTFPPVVGELLPHTPAPTRGKIRVGDRLLVINGTPIAQIPLEKTRSALSARPLTLIFRGIKAQASGGSAPGSRPTPPPWEYKGAMNQADFLRNCTDRLLEIEEEEHDTLQPYKVCNDLAGIARLLPSDANVQEELKHLLAKERSEVTDHDGFVGVPTVG